MSLLESHRALLIVLGAATLVALAGLLTPGHAQVWMTDAITGIATLATAFLVCTRLALGAPGVASRRLWLAALAPLGLVSAAQAAQLLGATGSLPPACGAIVAGAAAIWLILAARGEPMPRIVRRLLWLALAIQLAAVATDLGGWPAGAPWRFAADFLVLLSAQLYLLAAALFVAAARRERFAAQHRVEDVGDFARYLYATSGLFRKVRHPRIGNFTVPGHKLVFMAVRFVSWFPRIAPRVRDRLGIGIWRQLRDLCVVALRHGLDAQVYYMFELYRDERRARASGYLTRYETKNGLFKVLTWQVSKSRRRIVLGDKLGMQEICTARGIATVPILIVAKGGKLDRRCAPAALERDLFLKPRQAKGSKGAELVRYADGTYIRENGEKLDRAGLEDFIARRSAEDTILVQPRIENHPGLADLADLALMRIRVITCLDAANKPAITHAVLSNLCKLELNWPTDIEFGAAIDLPSGALGRITGDKAEMWLAWSDTHPITHARVRGRIVPCWDQVKQIALAAHAACNDRLLIGWDIAVGTDGAVLLEGNSYPDVDFLQRAHECAVGDSALGPLLYARLVDIERRSASGTLRGPLDYDTAEAGPVPVTPRAQ